MDDDLAPTAPLSLLRTGLTLLRTLERWNDGPERAPIYRDHYEEWTACNAQKLRALEGDLEALAERLDAIEQDRERVLLLGNYGLEAWREASDQRRAMLGDATVTAILSELSAAELARIERTIRLLDPEDLELLVALQEGSESTEMVDRWDFGGESETDGQWRYRRLTAGHLGGAALLASGCVLASALPRERRPGTDPWSTPPRRNEESAITPLGELVLRFIGQSRKAEMP